MARQSTRKRRNISRKIGKQNRKHSKKHVKKHLKRRKTNKHRGGGSYETDLKCVMDFEPKRFIGSNRLACSNDIWRKKNNVLFVMIGKEFNEDKWTNIKELLDVIIGQLYFLHSDLLDEKGELLEPIKKLLEPNQSSDAKKGRKHFQYTQTDIDRTARQLYPKVEFHIREEDPDKNIFNKIVFIYENGTIPENCKMWLMNHNSLIKSSNSNNNLLPEIEIVKKEEILETSPAKKWEWPAKPEVERNNWKSNNFFVCGNNNMIKEFLNNHDNSMIKPLQRKQEITKRYFNTLRERGLKWLFKGIVTYNIYILTDYLENQEELSFFQNSNVHGLKIKNIAKLKEQQDTDIYKIKTYKDAVEKLKQLDKEHFNAYEQYVNQKAAADKETAAKAEQLEAEQAKIYADLRAVAELEAAAEFKAEAKAAAELKNLEIGLRENHRDIFNELSKYNKGNTDIITIFFIKLHDIEMREKKAKGTLHYDKPTRVHLEGETFKIKSFYATPMFSSHEERKKVREQAPDEEEATGIRLVNCVGDDCNYITYKKFLDAGSDLELLEDQANRKLFESYTKLWED